MLERCVVARLAGKVDKVSRELSSRGSCAMLYSDGVLENASLPLVLFEASDSLKSRHMAEPHVPFLTHRKLLRGRYISLCSIRIAPL